MEPLGADVQFLATLRRHQPDLEDQNMRALIMTGGDVPAWEHDWAQGRRPSRFPYGAEQLAELGWEVRFNDARRGGRLRGKLRDVIEHRAGIPVEHAFIGHGGVPSADIALGLLEPYAAAPAALRRRGLPPFRSTPVAAVSCWAAERWLNGSSRERALAIRQVRYLERLYVLSRNQVPIYEQMGVDPATVIPVRYGVDAQFYTPLPGAEQDIDVLAVGLDGGRDYGTLFQAVKGMDLRVTLVAKPHNLERLSIPPNVEFIGSVDHLRYRELLRRARIVAVPTHERAYPTGQSVALEASAVGAPLIITSTPAISDYFTPGSTALMPAVGAAEEWRQALLTLSEDRERAEMLARSARREVLDRFTTAHLWADISADLCRFLAC